MTWTLHEMNYIHLCVTSLWDVHKTFWQYHLIHCCSAILLITWWLPTVSKHCRKIGSKD